MIDKYVKWHVKQNKLVRVVLKTLGYLIASVTAPIWFPSMIIVWIVLSAVCGIIEFIEKA